VSADLLDRGFDVGKFAPHELGQVDEPTLERVDDLAGRVEGNARGEPGIWPRGEGPTGDSAPFIDVDHQGHHLTIGERFTDMLGTEER